VSDPTIHSRRAARQLDAASVEAARAQAARVRAEQEAAVQAIRARARRDELAADAELAAAVEAERDLRNAARRAGRAARRTARLHAVVDRQVLLATVAAIALFVAVALPAQIGFLAQRWPWPMALAGGVALESLTWVFALQGQAREARGRSGSAHSTGVWAAAAVAAWVNLTHGAQMWGTGFAVVAACGSLAAPTTWHLYRLSQSEEPLANPAQLRRERLRRRHHRRVARLADRLATSLPEGLAPDTAWTLAWRAVHGAEPGITGPLLERHHKAAARVEALTAQTAPTAEATDEHRPLLLRPLPPGRNAAAVVAAAFANSVPLADLLNATSLTTHTGTYKQLTAHTALPGGGPYNPRTGAYSTSVPRSEATASDDAAMEAKRSQARTGIRRVLAHGGTPSPTEIGRAYGMSPEWGAKQIRAVRTEQHPHRPNSPEGKPK